MKIEFTFYQVNWLWLLSTSYGGRTAERESKPIVIPGFSGAEARSAEESIRVLFKRLRKDFVTRNSKTGGLEMLPDVKLEQQETWTTGVRSWHDDEIEGVYHILLLALHPDFSGRVNMATAEEHFWPMAQKIRVVAMLRKAIGIGEKEIVKRKIDHDPEPVGDQGDCVPGDTPNPRQIDGAKNT